MAKADPGTAETTNLSMAQGGCCPMGGDTPAIQFAETTDRDVIPPFCLLNDSAALL